ncbi:pre-mRNA-splicing factor 18-like [Gigantopelta aegis]|uniref:pre-mRNA-splicing factor 18-like n=1 Tax=Gigantopelta aegis TaxID=1735272 RepID=UPI001B88C35B|nr:pre-mRNA-splicing factor 18-like [Gigantopelta aegis]
MDILKAEIERKKRQLENSNILAPNKKYFKRGDLAAKQAEEYWKKHSNIQEEVTEEKESKENDTEAKRIEEKKIELLPRKDVIRKLRERGEPIRLFGETDSDSYLRLKKLETQEPDQRAHRGGNDFKDAMDQVDLQYLNEIIKSTGGQTISNDVSIKDDGTTEDDIPKMRKELGAGDPGQDQKIMLSFFKYVIKMWGKSLNERPEEEKRTTKGKTQSAHHTQTVGYLKPLFRKLKNKNVDEDILESLVMIVQRLMDRNYLKANDAYLEMAIGNAPWPIGVTMVGIHARTGREKISSRYVAHVLNDETQRKYIQGLKRLMTQCQKVFPTDPSRSFMYERKSIV